MSISKLLLAAAAAVFAQHPEADEVYVTEDGNAWLPNVKHLAHTHANAAKLPAPMLVTRKDIAKIEMVKQVVGQVAQAVNDAADRVVKDKADKEAEEARKAAEADAASAEEAEAEAARKAADEAAAAALEEAEQAAAKESTVAQEQAADAAQEQAAKDAEMKAADDASAKAKSTPKGGKKGK